MNIDTSNLNYMQTILADGTFRQAACRISPEEALQNFLKGRMENGSAPIPTRQSTVCAPRSTAPDSSAVRGCMQSMRIPLHQRAWNDYPEFVCQRIKISKACNYPLTGLLRCSTVIPLLYCLQIKSAYNRGGQENTVNVNFVAVSTVKPDVVVAYNQ